MVWKGHYLGYGPADVLLHVPVDNRLMAENDKVQIFAPYHVEAVRLVRNAQSMPGFDSIDSLAGKRLGVEQISIAAMVLLGEGNGRFREDVRIFPTAAAALQELKAGRLDAVLANRSEIQAVFKGDPAFPLEQALFQRLPRNGWSAEAPRVAGRSQTYGMGIPVNRLWLTRTFRRRHTPEGSNIRKHRHDVQPPAFVLMRPRFFSEVEMVSTSTLPLADTATSTATLQHSSKADDAAATLRLVSLLRKFGTWNFSPITGMVVMTPSSSDILGYSTNAAVHITTLLRALTKPDRSHIFASYRRLINLQSREEVADLVLSSERGESRYLRAAFRLLHEGDIGTGEILGLVQSTSEEHAISNQLERLTYYDAVTSLPNRKKFDDIFAERLEQRKQFGGELAFLIVDLTRFREVNFALSHVVGDDLLRMVAQRIRGVLCNNDEVARVGTRFPILLQDADGEHAARCAAEICSALEAPFPLQDISYEIGAHIGISLCPDDDLTYRGLLRKADIAVEQAAHKGQSVAKYDVTTDKHTPYRLALVGDFRHAAKNDEIRLYCQPKIEMRTRTVIGVEVLARWLHPTKGLIPPDDFVQLIEGTELIHVLTNHMLANAAQCLLRWQALGIAVPLAVNLSTQDVATPALSRYLAALLRSTQIDPKFIELEVTERSLIRNPTTSIGELNRLRDMGFRLSIDDFGTGYSSLNYLTQLPVDVIKIDHSFTMKMIRDQRSAAIVRSTIHMAHDLGMTVVAEGTADVDIWNALEALDCDEAQGYYIARPMPVEDFSTWLHNAGASFNRASVNQSR